MIQTAADTPAGQPSLGALLDELLACCRRSPEDCLRSHQLAACLLLHGLDADSGSEGLFGRLLDPRENAADAECCDATLSRARLLRAMQEMLADRVEVRPQAAETAGERLPGTRRPEAAFRAVVGRRLSRLLPGSRAGSETLPLDEARLEELHVLGGLLLGPHVADVTWDCLTTSDDAEYGQAMVRLVSLYGRAGRKLASCLPADLQERFRQRFAAPRPGGPAGAGGTTPEDRFLAVARLVDLRLRCEARSADLVDLAAQTLNALLRVLGRESGGLEPFERIWRAGWADAPATPRSFPSAIRDPKYLEIVRSNFDRITSFIGFQSSERQTPPGGQQTLPSAPSGQAAAYHAAFRRAVCRHVARILAGPVADLSRRVAEPYWFEEANWLAENLLRGRLFPLVWQNLSLCGDGDFGWAVGQLAGLYGRLGDEVICAGPQWIVKFSDSFFTNPNRDGRLEALIRLADLRYEVQRAGTGKENSLREEFPAAVGGLAAVLVRNGADLKSLARVCRWVWNGLTAEERQARHGAGGRSADGAPSGGADQVPPDTAAPAENGTAWGPGGGKHGTATRPAGWTPPVAGRAAPARRPQRSGRRGPEPFWPYGPLRRSSRDRRWLIAIAIVAGVALLGGVVAVVYRLFQVRRRGAPTPPRRRPHD